MKKIYTLLLLALSGLLVIANPVDVKLAQKVAINYLSAKKGAGIDTFDLKLINTHQFEGKDALYIFAMSKGGFVIVSADDEAKPIIGWSLTNPMPQKIDNPVVFERLNWYAKQVHYAAKSNIGDKSVKQEWQDILDGKIAKGVKGAGPLLATIWNQEPYYNMLCPTGTPTGCVATAMSQIMRYHQWPQNGIGWHKYVHSTYGTQYANFEATTYTWASMPNELTAGSTYEEKVAVATLCYHAGVAVNMNYATDGSGAFSRDVLYALTNYFNYDPTTIQIYTFDPNNQTEWINMVKTEIDAGRPIYYSGSSSASGG
ncbi:MAG: C10 family peptidase, partial [Bacteroidales bacterium]|nr:C10 family peptidase [Bacteroidales bacterium]